MLNLANIIAGAVNGAVQAVIPPVAADVIKTIHKAQDASPMAPPIPPPPALDADAIAGKVLDQVLSDPAIAKVTTPVPWYQSHAIWGNIISVLSLGAGVLGYSISAQDQALAAGSFAGVGIIIGNLLSIYGRLTTTRQIKGV